MMFPAVPPLMIPNICGRLLVDATELEVRDLLRRGCDQQTALFPGYMPEWAARPWKRTSIEWAAGRAQHNSSPIGAAWCVEHSQPETVPLSLVESSTLRVVQPLPLP